MRVRRNNAGITIAVVISILMLALGLCMGYIKGNQEAKTPDASEGTKPSTTLAGVYRYIFQDAMGRESYSFMVFLEGGKCRQYSATGSNLPKIDFTKDVNRMKCEYTYNKDSGNGRISTSYEDSKGNYSEPYYEYFTFKNGGLVIGGASYTRIQADYEDRGSNNKSTVMVNIAKTV